MRHPFLILAASLLLFACKGEGDDGDDSPPDGGVTDTGTVDSGTDAGARDSGPPDSGRSDAGMEEVVVVEVGDPYGEPGEINPPGDRDLFSFEAVEGQWLRIITRSGGSPIDPVITLFDSNMNQLAESDDDIPRTGTDSEINFHVPASGTYFVEVQEYATWAGATPVGGPDYDYSLRVLIWDDQINGVVIDPENGDDAASAAPEEFGIVLGTFRDPSDVDVYRVRVGSSTIAQYDVTILPAGPEGQGSTTRAGNVWITDATGSEIIARIDNDAGSNSIDPPLFPGDYLLWIAHPGGSAGTNDYYVLKPRLFEDNPPERGDPQNDTIGGAETLRFSDDGMRRSGFVLAQLPEGDIDYFVIEARETESLAVACGAESGGSGVRGLTAEVRDRNDVVIMTGTEDPADGLFIMGFVPTSTGTYYVRLSADTPAPDVTSRFVRCGLHATRPPP